MSIRTLKELNKDFSLMNLESFIQLLIEELSSENNILFNEYNACLSSFIHSYLIDIKNEIINNPKDRSILILRVIYLEKLIKQIIKSYESKFSTFSLHSLKSIFGKNSSQNQMNFTHYLFEINSFLSRFRGLSELEKNGGTTQKDFLYTQIRDFFSQRLKISFKEFTSKLSIDSLEEELETNEILLHTEKYTPSKDIFNNNAVIFIHGTGSISSHYNPLFLRLVKEGYVVYSCELPAHNRSTGLYRIGIYSEVAKFLKQLAEKENPNCLIHFMGHSIGAISLLFNFFGLNYKMERELNALMRIREQKIIENIRREQSNKNFDMKVKELSNVKSSIWENLMGFVNKEQVDPRSPILNKDEMTFFLNEVENYIELFEEQVDGFLDIIERNKSNVFVADSNVTSITSLGCPVSLREAKEVFKFGSLRNNLFARLGFYAFNKLMPIVEKAINTNIVIEKYQRTHKYNFFQLYLTNESWRSFIDYSSKMLDPFLFIKIISDSNNIQNFPQFEEIYQKIIAVPKSFLFGEKDPVVCSKRFNEVSYQEVKLEYRKFTGSNQNSVIISFPSLDHNLDVSHNLFLGHKFKQAVTHDEICKFLHSCSSSIKNLNTKKVLQAA